LPITLLSEEIRVLVEADEIRDIEEIAKEATDVLYVLLGTALELGHYPDFEDKILFEGNFSNINKSDPIIQLLELVELFKTDWNKDNLGKLVLGLGEYLEYKGLKSSFIRIIHEVHRSNMSKCTNYKPIGLVNRNTLNFC
jgi:Phosphoribosyl-ATP pyrophosphohydrolase